MEKLRDYRNKAWILGIGLILSAIIFSIGLEEICWPLFLIGTLSMVVALFLGRDIKKSSFEEEQSIAKKNQEAAIIAAQEREQRELRAEERWKERVKQKQEEEQSLEAYKDKIYALALKITINPSQNELFENFLKEIPINIFIYTTHYSLFETFLLDNLPISIGKNGGKVLWTTEADFGIIRPFTSLDFASSSAGWIVDVRNFYFDKFQKMIKLLINTVKFDNYYDAQFVLLRLIQLRASSWCRGELERITGIEFPNIENSSLGECLFIYYSTYKSKIEKIFEEPALCYLTHLLIYNNKFEIIPNEDYQNYLAKTQLVKSLLISKREEFEYRMFEVRMKKTRLINEPKLSILDIDMMSGEEFENFIAKLFTKLGYHTRVTKLTGDYGVDIVAEKGELKIAIQAKCHVNPISNSAIQEITAGMKFYQCQRGMVVTNSTFTKSAIELARTNKIQLWDRKVLEEKISEVEI